MFFGGWNSLGRTLVVGVLGYVGVVFFLRISGKRTLSKMNAFDFIVTIALGSTLASMFVSPNVRLVEGLLALALLIFLQYAVTSLAVRSRRFQGVIKAQPTLLFHRGQALPDGLRRERVTREELLTAIRMAGYSDPDSVAAVVLETDGSLSVLGEYGTRGTSTLANVRRPDPPRA